MSNFRGVFVRRTAAALALIAGTSAAAGCGLIGDSGPSIVVYNAQHEALLQEIAPKFTDETGIEVELRNGKDSELAAQLLAEGDGSPADVFLTENSPSIAAVERAGLLRNLSPEATDPIPAQYRPDSGLWTGFVARSTVLFYNSEALTAADMPASLLELAEPQWRGRLTFSPTGADFQAIVAAVLDLEGEEATRTWLEGLKANGAPVDGNNVVLQSVNDGLYDVGIAYHYYWYRDQKEAGESSDNTAVHFFADQDPGAFISVSGAGVLASSDNKPEADAFVAYLTSVAGQQALADSYALEYPLNPEVQLAPPVKPLDELEPPTVRITDLDGDTVVELLTEVGFL